MFAEREITAVGPSGLLAGTLSGPLRAHAPLMLIISGSGPTDRDGNSPLGEHAGTYRLLAEGLAERQVACLRMDKRGMFGSQAAASDANDVTIEDYADDIEAWVAAVRQDTDFGDIVLFGHSEGGLVALETAARAQSAVGGLILAATPGRPFGDLVLAQLEDIGADTCLIEAAAGAIAALAEGRAVDAASLPRQLEGLFRPELRRFLTSLIAFDPLASMRRCGQPKLIVQGDRDIQVGVADAKALQRHGTNATLVVLPEATHVLKQITGKGRAANIATYSDPTRPLAPNLVETLDRFIKSMTAS